jgi:hypothetical protein
MFPWTCKCGHISKTKTTKFDHLHYYCKEMDAPKKTQTPRFKKHMGSLVNSTTLEAQCADAEGQVQKIIALENDVKAFINNGYLNSNYLNNRAFGVAKEFTPVSV